MPPPSNSAEPARVIILMGVSGCGKTVVGKLLAADLGWEFVDADGHHPPENVERMRRGIPLEDEHRWPWLDRLAGLVDAALDRGSGGAGLVLACSALKRSYRDRIGAGRPGVRLVHLDGPESLIRERIEQRTLTRQQRGGHVVPGALLERPKVDESAITVDIAATPVEIARNIRAAVAAG